MQLFKILSVAAFTGLATAVSTERIREVFGVLIDGRWDDFYAMGAHPNMTWSLQGDWEYTGTYNLTEIQDLNRQVNVAIEGGILRTRIDNIVNDNWNSATLEMSTLPGTKGTNGAPYHQNYCFVTEWEGDRILRGREYLDTDLGLRLFAPPS